MPQPPPGSPLRGPRRVRPGNAAGAARRVGPWAACLAAAWMAAGTAAADDRPPPVPPERREAVASEIRELFALQNQLSTYPLPALDEERLSELLDGKLVRFREKWTLSSGHDEKGEEEPRERHRVLAFYLIRRPRDMVWVASIDPHFLGNDRLSEARLETAGTKSVWYQLLDPPWPVKNRHWVIDVVKATDVATGSADRIWEQWWNLADDGERIALEATANGRVPEVPLERALKSRYLEENVGAWTIFGLDDDLTLAAYQLTVVMGGWVPERLTARFAMGALEELMQTVEKATVHIEEHYDADHRPIMGGDGRIIPPFRATDDGRRAEASRDEPGDED